MCASFFLRVHNGFFLAFVLAIFVSGLLTDIPNNECNGNKQSPIAIETSECTTYEDFQFQVSCTCREGRKSVVLCCQRGFSAYLMHSAARFFEPVSSHCSLKTLYFLFLLENIFLLLLYSFFTERMEAA